MGVVKQTPNTKLEKLKKEVHDFLKEEFGLSIALEADLTVVNFLDISFFTLPSILSLPKYKRQRNLHQ